MEQETAQTVETKILTGNAARSRTSHPEIDPMQGNPDTRQQQGDGHIQKPHRRMIGRGADAHLFQQAIATLNGLITNDKFCMIRSARLHLTWSRRPLRLQPPAAGESAYPLDENTHPGGADETPVANSPRTATEAGRATPVGSSLPTPSDMGTDDPAGNGQCADSLFSIPSGGVS
jgi:hypothetical protein